MNTVSRLEVRKDDLPQTRWQTRDAPALAGGEVRLGIESFALTANNITYAAFGDAMNYWQFFPTGDDAWGCIPVWGFAAVTESQCEGVAAGEKFYGYYPMASELVMQPARVTTAGFFDGAGHRQALPVVYNQYLRCSADPFYDAATEDVQSLLRPLFITSFLIDDFLADNDFFGGAKTLLLSSASSKTAYGTAFQLAKRAGLEVVGLTSPGNQAFCESLGCYSRILAYEELDSIAADTPCIYVDFAGNAGLRQRIHGRFEALRYNCAIGGTHVGELAAKGSARDLPGPKPVLFFAPAQVKKRIAEGGAPAFGRQLTQAWQNFTRQVTGAQPPWLVTRRHAGQAPMQAVYREVLAGQGDPRTGHILTP
jgi:hypothetical protein